MIGLAQASIHIEAPQRQVFELFTTEQGLCTWMAKEAAVDLRPGGKWRWVHDNDAAASGEYVVVDPYRRVTFTFGWESGEHADMGPGSTHVEVMFEPSVTGTGTEVRVSHSSVPARFADAHGAGWTYFLGLLARAACGEPLPADRLPAGVAPPMDSVARPADS